MRRGRSELRRPGADLRCHADLRLRERLWLRSRLRPLPSWLRLPQPVPSWLWRLVQSRLRLPEHVRL
jgi:hypothetical protein